MTKGRIASFIAIAFLGLFATAAVAGCNDKDCWVLKTNRTYVGDKIIPAHVVHVYRTQARVVKASGEPCDPCGESDKGHHHLVANATISRYPCPDGGYFLLNPVNGMAVAKEDGCGKLWPGKRIHVNSDGLSWNSIDTPDGRC